VSTDQKHGSGNNKKVTVQRLKEINGKLGYAGYRGGSNQVESKFLNYVNNHPHRDGRKSSYKYCYYAKTTNAMKLEDYLLEESGHKNEHNVSNCQEGSGYCYVLANDKF